MFINHVVSGLADYEEWDKLTFSFGNFYFYIILYADRHILITDLFEVTLTLLRETLR